jgi:hypothetical protein
MISFRAACVALATTHIQHHAAAQSISSFSRVTTLPEPAHAGPHAHFGGAGPGSTSGAGSGPCQALCGDKIHAPGAARCP